MVDAEKSTTDKGTERHRGRHGAAPMKVWRGTDEGTVRHR